MRFALILLAGCGGAPVAPTTHGIAIDRFSKAAAHLMVGAHAPGTPIDLDVPPFVTQGLGPDGHPVRYYNFDVQPDVPDTLYRVVRPGSREVVAEVIDALPGQAGYSDFHRIAWVEVASGIPTNAATLREGGAMLDASAVDCPVVPAGTHGKLGGTPHEVWYRGERVTCLMFGDPLLLANDRVPTSPIYVTFADKGFATEGATTQTHNVVFSVPGDVEYSPLWAVHVYDPKAFAAVHDAASAEQAPLLEPHGPLVNCPLVQQ